MGTPVAVLAWHSSGQAAVQKQHCWSLSGWSQSQTRTEICPGLCSKLGPSGPLLPNFHAGTVSLRIRMGKAHSLHIKDQCASTSLPYPGRGASAEKHWCFSKVLLSTRHKPITGGSTGVTHSHWCPQGPWHVGQGGVCATAVGLYEMPSSRVS